ASAISATRASATSRPTRARHTSGAKPARTRAVLSDTVDSGWRVAAVPTRVGLRARVPIRARRPRELDEAVAGHAPDLLDRGHACKAEADAVLPQRLHPLLDGGREDLLRRGLDQTANPALDLHHLVQRNASRIAGAVAVQTTCRAIKADLRGLALAASNVLELCRGRRVLLAAMQTEPTRKPLRNDAVDRRREQARLDAHVLQARDRTG